MRVTKLGLFFRSLATGLLLCIVFIFTFFLMMPKTSLAQSAPQGTTPTAGTSTRGYSAASREYHLKAAFLRYVVQYVNWPSDVLPQNHKIRLCVLGMLPIFDPIQTIDGKVANGHAIEVSKILTPKEAMGACDIVYVTRTAEDNFRQIIRDLGNQPILIFGDTEQFANLGGDMNFYIVNNKLAILVNLASIEASKLTIDPKMLRLVTVIPPVSKQAPDKKE